MHFSGSQIPPDAYNYAGIYAFDGRPGLANCRATATPSPSRCMGTPQHGVLVQIQLLRSYADPSAKTAPNRFISAPSDRAGDRAAVGVLRRHQLPVRQADLGVGDDYGLRIIQMYSGALVESGMAGACVPYAPPVAGATSGTGYWDVTARLRRAPVRRRAVLRRYRATSTSTRRSPAASRRSSGTGYWLLGRDGGIFSYGDAHFYGSTGAHAPQQARQRHGAHDNDGRATGSSPTTAASSPSATRTSTVRRARSQLNKPVLGMERTASGKGYWLFASDGGIFSFGDAQVLRLARRARTLTSPVVSMQRTATGKGYWMMTQDGRIFAFGDAHGYGDIAGCSNYERSAAPRMLVAPDGDGYWIATGNGQHRRLRRRDQRLGFPAAIGGPTHRARSRRR